jgi:tetratricopeptide (TPR) repeat protein
MNRTLVIAPAVLVACIATSSQARAEPEQLKMARYHFELNEHQEAVQFIDGVLGLKLLASEPELVEAYRIHGLSHFYLGHRDEARRSFVKLLSIDPDFNLDPKLVAPLALVEFNQAKLDNEQLLAPLRERRRAIAEQRRLEEEARQRLLAEEEKKRKEREAKQEVILRVEKHAWLTNFLPFGIPQFEQGRSRAGTIIAVSEGLGIFASVLTYSQVQARRDDNGEVRREDMEKARRWRTANWVSFGTASAIYLAGLADALIHHQEEVASYIPVPRRAVAPPARPPEPPAAAVEPRASFLLFPGPDGVAAGLAGRF